MLAKNTSKNGLRLNLGCGTIAPEGWINVDSSPNVLLAKIPLCNVIKKVLFSFNILSKEAYNAEYNPRIIFCDLTKHFPEILPSSCGVIYTSHFLEHVLYDDCLKLLEKCYVVLSDGGILRIAVPDLFTEAKEYVERIERAKQEQREDSEASRQFIQLLFLRTSRQAHLWMYDFFSLSLLLKQTGFVNIVQKSFRESMIEDIDLVEHRQDSLFIECRKN
ncbi:MAG: hypothetical protein HY094_01615 [Candidatus Melainabacteria bacterium]|nr:hypothetical protein [Candidatus Melainabacteria bacterium]